MSEKELLYIDDALGHFVNIDEFLTCYMEDVEDENFLTVLEGLQKMNQDVYKKFYKLTE